MPTPFVYCIAVEALPLGSEVDMRVHRMRECTIDSVGEGEKGRREGEREVGGGGGGTNNY